MISDLENAHCNAPDQRQLSSHLVGTLGSPSQFTYICAGLSPPLNVESNRSWCWQPYYFDEISRFLAIYISTILRPLTCSVVELIQLLLLYTERNAAVIPRLNGRFFFRSIYRTKRGVISRLNGRFFFCSTYRTKRGRYVTT